MGSIAVAFATAFRDYVTDGVPASGKNDPVKSEVRAIGALVESALGTLSLGSVSVTKDTRAHLNADLAHAVDTVALVYADATDANNDLYVKVGASGSGSWTLTGILHTAIAGLTAPAITAATAQAVLAGHYANDDTDVDVPGGTAGDRGAKYWADKASTYAVPQTEGHQTFGYPGGAIPDGTTTVGGSGPFATFEPALGDGVIAQVRLYAAAAGSLSLQRYRMDNGVFTAVGSPTVVTVPGAGYRVIAATLSFLEGEIIAFTDVSASCVRFSTGGTNDHERADGSGIFLSVSNGGAVGTPQQNLRFHIGFDAAFHSKRAQTQRNLITVASSDKIVFQRNSYMSEIYTLRGKAVAQKVADLTEWRVENFSGAGLNVTALLTRIQSDEQTYSYLGMRDVNPTWLVLGEFQNSVITPMTVAQYVDGIRQLVVTGKSLGAGVIVATEHSAEYSNGGIEVSPNIVRKVALDYGAIPLSFRQNANIFAPSFGGYASDYAGWTVGGHLSLRYSEILAQPLRELVATTLGRPKTSLRVFRPRPNADGSAPTIASTAALLFEPDDLTARHALFSEIAHGQAALDDASEKYLDEVNSGSVAAANYASEYLALQLGLTASFTDYAYVEAILGANGRDVQGHGIRVSDAGCAVYVRDALYRDLVDTGYPASTAPTGRWRQIGIDSDGFARLTGRNTVGTIFGDKVCWLIAKSGAFTLGEPRVEWYGEAGKVCTALKPTNRALGTELITNPYLVSAGALASGWSATGTPTFGTGLQTMLPRGATGHTVLTTADKATVALSWAADQYHDREIEVTVWAAVPKTLVSSGASYPSAASITRYTNDYEQLLVEIVGGTNAVPHKFAVGLYWQEVRFRTWAAAGSTGFSLRLSAFANSIAVARASAKLVEP